MAPHQHYIRASTCLLDGLMDQVTLTYIIELVDLRRQTATNAPILMNNTSKDDIGGAPT